MKQLSRKTWLASQGFAPKNNQDWCVVNHDKKAVAISCWFDIKHLVIGNTPQWKYTSNGHKKTQYLRAVKNLQHVLNDGYQLYIYYIGAEDETATTRKVSTWKPQLIEADLRIKQGCYFAIPTLYEMTRI